MNRLQRAMARLERAEAALTRAREALSDAIALHGAVRPIEDAVAMCHPQAAALLRAVAERDKADELYRVALEKRL